MSSFYPVSSRNPRELHPILEAKAESGDDSLLKKVAHAFGTVFSNMGLIAFTAGIFVVSILLLPISIGTAEAAILAYPAYLALSGASALFIGEIAKHMSERNVTKLTVCA